MLNNETYSHAAAEALARRHSALRDAAVRRDAKLQQQQTEWRARLEVARSKFEAARDALNAFDGSATKAAKLEQAAATAQAELTRIESNRPDGHGIRNEHAAVVAVIDRTYHQELNVLRSRLGFVPA